MKKILAFICSVAVISSAVLPVSYAADDSVVIHVSPNGTVEGDGTESNPVNSIEAAITKARQHLGKAITVKFHAGQYKVTGETKFLAVDSGTAENPIVYTTYGDGEVEFTGATKLNQNNFKKVIDPLVLAKIPQSARAKVMVYNLAESGLSYSLNDSVRPYLYVDDELKITARYPNDSHLMATLANGGRTFTFNDYDVSKWESAKDAVLCGSTGATYFWRNTDISVSGNVITAETQNVRKNTEFWVENLIEELDVPGEYFVDRENNLLYYYPGEDIKTAKVEITSNFNKVISMNNTNNVTFDGLKFDKIGGEAFYIDNAKNVNIKNCTIDYSQGENAIYFKGSDSVISDNSFYGCANRVIEFHGGSVKTLTKGNIEVKNNRISMCGFYGKNDIIFSGSSATSLPSDFGNRISNNLIQDCMTFMGICVNANDYLIDYNEIINPGYLIKDGGAIYMGRSNAKYGTEVAYNYIHDGHKGDENYYYCGVYSDDGYGGNYFHHNVIRDMYQGMILNIGMNCRFNNNLMINNTTQSGGRSVMVDYTVAGGAVENGHQDLFYNEVNTIINKTVWGSTFASHYPYLVETLDRVPYFAPWDTEIVGNVSIGCNGRGLEINPWHLYYKADGVTPVIAGESRELAEKKGAIFNADRYSGSNLVKGEKIDEIKMYGKEVLDENGNSLNSTKLGNPIFDYNEAYFKDPANQDYSLTDAFSCDVSTVDEIDMSLMSITKTTNPDIYSNKSRELNLLSPANGVSDVYENDVKFTWDRVRDASKYRLVVSENSDLSNPVHDVTFNDSSDAIIKVVSLEKGKTYYWQVTAIGLAKNDSFEINSDIYSFATRSGEIWNTENAEQVLEILNNQIDDYKNGVIEYSDDKIHNSLIALSAEASAVMENAVTQAEYDGIEEEMLEKLVESADYITEREPVISECYVDQDSDNVYVKGAGFRKNAMVTVMVTNPDATLESAENMSDLSQIQYVDTIVSDSNGNISFVFKTRFDGRDRSGEYTVYIRNNDGLSITKTYNYGIIYADAIKYKNAAGEELSDLSGLKGEKVTLSCMMHNDTDKDISPAIITAVYNGEKLVSASLDETQSVGANSEKELTWQAAINTEGATHAKVLFVESTMTLKPLTKYRLIYEKTN